MKFIATACLLARFDTRQIGPRLTVHGRRALRSRQSAAPRFTDGRLLQHFPCPTAFGLLNNSPKNAAPQRFQIGLEQALN
jgi:hypothetical protein